ncbi:MAG: hypothetical protein Q8M31_14170 [Beijerinckiaceae bacterium]|nr:hypothetical protein [Beijerinckiaceae bacterium]
MISGQQALRRIEAAAGKIRGQESELQIALTQASARGERLRADRIEAFKQLAAVRLDALRGQNLISDLDAAERRALDQLAEAERELARLGGERARLDAVRASAEQQRHARADELSSALAALEDLQARIEPVVRQQPDWLAQKKAVEAAQAIADESDKKAKVAEADLESKRKPYEADPLFMYLWRRKFSTSEYKSGFFVRFWDRKIAALVNYQDARANYSMLNEIPTRLRAHAQRRIDEVANQNAKLGEIELAALRAAGSGVAEERVATARAAARSADDALMAAEAAIAALDARQGEFTRSRTDSAFNRAVDLVASADAQETIEELYREARQTPTREDDMIVARIEKIDAELVRAEEEMSSLRRKAQEVAGRRIEVERERDSFRKRGWDNPYGQVSNEGLLGDVLGNLIKGAIQGAVLGGVLKDGYRERRPRANSGFGGKGGFNFPLPPLGGDSDSGGGGWIGGGGSWGGDGDSGGGSGGDGFTTGGSI